MSKSDLYVRVAAILATLAECGGSSPETPVYMALGCDHSAYMDVRMVLTSSGLCTLEGNVLSLTGKGQETAEKCNAVLAGAH